MQALIHLKNTNPISLPLAHHHILQAVIYELLADDSDTKMLHDEGSVFENRVYKLFTFGPLTGRYEVKGHRITFLDDMTMTIRAKDKSVIEAIRLAAEHRGIRIGERIFTDVEVEVTDYAVDRKDILISMVSPICVYSTDVNTKHTTYYSPDDSEFEALINDNFVRKYWAATGERPASSIMIRPIDVRPRDRYVTRYKNYIIEGWKGTYRLTGEPEYLTFLMNTGLGAKNSQGFGMFTIIDR